MRRHGRDPLSLNLQRWLWIGAGLWVLVSWFIAPAHAATITVTNTDDSGAGSLRGGNDHRDHRDPVRAGEVPGMIDD